VRMALGADRGSVVAMVVRGAFWQVGIGLGIGIPAAIGAGYLMASRLFGLTPWNPLLLAGATVLLGLAALVAAVIPARESGQHRPGAGAAQRMIHLGAIQINRMKRCLATDRAQF